MNKNIGILLGIFGLAIIAAGIVLFVRIQDTQAPASQNGFREEKVGALVESFGSRLKNVSLLAEPAQVRADMEREYGPYVKAELITQWATDPTYAPGRLTSSPWPDRIAISSIKEVGEDKYAIEGRIIEATSASTTPAAERNVHIEVVFNDEQPQITQVVLGEYIRPGMLSYKNTEYGFTLSLPLSWQGYIIVMQQWEGEAPGGPQVEQGPLLLIRHPLWTKEVPRQDIPILIFTHAQWETLAREEFHIGAAPIGPRQLGKNKRYVFALPARYNFAFLPGFEEVDQIIQSNPLQGI